MYHECLLFSYTFFPPDIVLSNWKFTILSLTQYSFLVHNSIKYWLFQVFRFGSLTILFESLYFSNHVLSTFCSKPNKLFLQPLSSTVSLKFRVSPMAADAWVYWFLLKLSFAKSSGIFQWTVFCPAESWLIVIVAWLDLHFRGLKWGRSYLFFVL